MFNLFTSNPISEMQSLRDRAERIGVTYLEAQAVKGTVTKAMIITVARTLNISVSDLIDMVPDRRRPARYAKAMAALRKSDLIGTREMYEQDRE